MIKRGIAALFTAVLAIVGTGALAEPAGAETYTCEFRGKVAVYSWSASKFVSAEFGYGGDFRGVLRARADEINDWEDYALKWCPGHGWSQTGYPGVQGGMYFPARSLYVAAERGCGGSLNNVLRARTDPNKLGPWEQFSITDLSGHGQHLDNSGHIWRG